MTYECASSGLPALYPSDGCAGGRAAFRRALANPLQAVGQLGAEAKASAIGRRFRSRSYRYLYDPHTRQRIKVGMVAVPVTLIDHPQPLFLVLVRHSGGATPSIC